MKPLFAFADRGDVRKLVEKVSDCSVVQGVVVDYDPLWMFLWRIRCQRGEYGTEIFARNVFDRLYRAPWWPGAMLAAIVGHADFGETDPPNPNWVPDWWIDYQHFLGRPQPTKEPFVVKVCLLPWQQEEKLPDFNEYSFPVLRERRRAAQFCMPKTLRRPVPGGVSIGTGARDSGTLGGIVQDQHGQRWGVTCAHVIGSTVSVDQPAQYDNRTSTPIGMGRYFSQLQATSASSPCNPYHTGSGMNVVDATLIEIDRTTSADLQVLQHGPLSGITPKANLNPCMLVEMAGKESGLRTLEVGGLCVTYRLRDMSGKFYCFHHLFELRWPQGSYALGRWPVQTGDSGAWIIASQAGGAEWAGMAIAGDHRMGYAVFSQNVTDWARQDHGLYLRVN